MKLTVIAEGRPDVWLAEKKNVAAWLRKNFARQKVHNFIGNGPVIIGADWAVADVIRTVKHCDRLAIMTGTAQRQNMRHALSVITGRRLDLFDIGEIAESDLAIKTG